MWVIGNPQNQKRPSLIERDLLVEAESRDFGHVAMPKELEAHHPLASALIALDQFPSSTGAQAERRDHDKLLAHEIAHEG